MNFNNDTANKQSHSLPPNVLIRVFENLPISSLANVAMASRRFKVLAYDDEIWDTKLKIMLESDTGALAALLEDPNAKLSLIDKDTSFLINNKPLNTLIPGMSRDPYNERARAKSTGHARERFKELYIRIAPYYLDLRNINGKSKVLQDFGSAPETCGKTLNLLVGLGKCKVVDDWRELNDTVEALCQYFESASLHEFEIAYDSNKPAEMKVYAHAIIALNGGSLCIQTFLQKHPIFYDNPFKPEDNFVSSGLDIDSLKNLFAAITDAMKQQAELIIQVFPPSADVFYMFADRVFEDVVNSSNYLYAISSILTLVYSLVDVITGDDVAIRIDKERGINLLYKLFFPLLDDYLEEEKKYVEKKYGKEIADWNQSSGERRDDPSVRLTNQSRELFKRNYLLAFKKVIALPIDLVSSAATTIASPFQRSMQFSFKSEDKTANKRASSTLASSSRNSIPTPTTPETKSLEPSDALENAQHELDALQNLLSLSVAVNMIHVNKDSERRVQRFINIGFPGRMKQDIQKTFEAIFINLLKTLGHDHIQTAFERASKRLLSYKPDPESLKFNNGEVPPLTEFFGMVHLADLMQHMIQAYYDEEITKYVDKHDFMNDINKEKKSFERLLDDCVAQGMDHGIQVLLAQVEMILSTEQKPEDYNPPSDIDVDLKPTKACFDAIECLKKNISMLSGAAEKSTMDLFFSEIGRRFFEVLCKHLKAQTVNEMGGLRYICDMNAYYAFAVDLKQRAITPYFSALKSLSNVYIITSPQDIKSVIHDLERYHGLMRIEDLFEFASCRADWPIIKKVVQKDMTDCSIICSHSNRRHNHCAHLFHLIHFLRLLCNCYFWR
ncbi:exocyst complex component Sec10-domain-containing protein [Phycomyces blakesleeanus]|uniref:Exocyst complex component Sec10-domain-containing protein n=1 Tax=Phycomyces blakesleeanus TaxID=4837 RepID=A0ABR3BF57_PHYBL